jgi:hypothetical protein
MKKFQILCAVTALLLAGCTVPIPLPQKTPLAPAAADAEGKRFAPPAGKANIYVARTSIVGSRYRFGVLLDGKAAGLVALDTYLLLQVDAGPHRIGVTTPENQYAVDVDAREGQSYFFEAVSRTGFAYANAELRPLADAEGRRVVLQTRRADNLYSD